MFFEVLGFKIMVLSALKTSRRSYLSKRGIKRNRVNDVNDDVHKNNVSDGEIED